MRTRLSLPGIACLACLAAVAHAQAPAPPPRRSDPFDRTRTQIDKLLAHRAQVPEFDASRFNPFHIGALPGTELDPPDGGPTNGGTSPATNNQLVLAQVGPTVRVTGFFAREDRTYVVIDGVPRKEGDFITLPYQGTNVNIRIRRVEVGRLTLGLGEAELVVRF